MQDDELLAKYPPDDKQRLDQLGQVGEVLDQLLDAGLELQAIRRFRWPATGPIALALLHPLRWQMD